MSLDNKFVRSLIQNAKQGNNAAIEQLFQMNLGKIYAFALRLTANKSLAESITRDTFIEAWKKINLVRPDASFLKWLNAITVYHVIDGLRSQKDSKKSKSEAREIELKDELDGYILNLPEQERMIFVLNRLEGYTVEEISDLMGIKKDQVNIHLKIANDKIIENDPVLKSEETLKTRLAKLIPEIEPPASVRDSIFSYIMEEKLKEQREIEKIAAQVEKEEEEAVDDEEFAETKKEIAKEDFVLPKRKIKFNFKPLRNASLVIAAGLVIYFLIKLIFSGGGWEIMQFSGQPLIDNNKVTEGDVFSEKSAITTDNNSTVTISIPEVGRVMIDTSSVVKRVGEGFTLEVEKGQIKKYEGNASDVLTVQTPLAVVKEFYEGSAFRLRIMDHNQAKINVESGWIVVEVKEFKSYIPKNYDCLISKGHYVLPYASDTNPELKSLYEGFSGVNDPSLGTIISMATRKDAITLWHLLQLISNENRFIVYDRLSEFIPVPNGVTKEGIQALNKNMLMQWRQEIELKMD